MSIKFYDEELISTNKHDHICDECEDNIQIGCEDIDCTQGRELCVECTKEADEDAEQMQEDNEE